MKNNNACCTVGVHQQCRGTTSADFQRTFMKNVFNGVGINKQKLIKDTYIYVLFEGFQEFCWPIRSKCKTLAVTSWTWATTFHILTICISFLTKVLTILST